MAKKAKPKKPPTKLAQPNTAEPFSPEEALIATIAASFMPKLSTGPRITPSLSLREVQMRLDGERAGHAFLHVKPDGSTLLDVLMDEAIYRAKLLLARVQGQESPTRLAYSKKIQNEGPKARMLTRVAEKLKLHEGVIRWQDLAAWVLPEASDAMRAACWKLTNAFYMHIQLLNQDVGEFEIIWESDARPADRKNPNVYVMPDPMIVDIIPIDEICHYAEDLLDTYQRSAVSIRKQLSRLGGAKGGRKTQRKIRAEAEGDAHSSYGHGMDELFEDR